METLRYTCIQISPLWFASLRSEEVVIRKSAQGNFFHGCHGNAEIHMHTKFYFHALHAWFASLRSEEVVMGKST